MLTRSVSNILPAAPSRRCCHVATSSSLSQLLRLPHLHSGARCCSTTTTTSASGSKPAAATTTENTNTKDNSSSSTSSTTPTMKDQVMAERAEHANFLKFLRAHHIDCGKSTPQHLCSSARLDRERQVNRESIMEAQGRGLVATSDIFAGTVIASAPLLDCAIHTDRLLELGTMTTTTSSSSSSSSSSPPPPFAESYKFLPQPAEVARLAYDTIGIRDHFIAQQAHFALLLALERCNEDSILKPYFETLPHPAVDDKLILDLYRNLLGPDGVDAYSGHCTEYLKMLQVLRDAWIQHAQSKLGKKKAEDEVFIPPMQLINWAWRTTLSHQSPLPVYGKPNLSHADQRRFGLTNNHYTNWVAIHENEPDAIVYPCLLPLFDLVNHGPVPNVRIDIVTRGRHEQHSGTTNSSSSSHEYDDVHEPGRKVVLDCERSLFSRVKSKLFGGGGSGDEDKIAFIELQALNDIKAGSELQTRFVVEDHAFTLYRFGFFPVTY